MPDRAGGYVKGALTVLRATGRPMTAKEVTDEAIRLGILHPTGMTPEATMTARLYCHVRDTPDSEIVRVHEQKPTESRARRGSVRWMWRRVR